MGRRRIFGGVLLLVATLAGPVAEAQTADDVPGATQHERLRYREQFRNATSDAERQRIRAEYQARVRLRRQQPSGQGPGGGGGGQGGGQGGGGSG